MKLLFKSEIGGKLWNTKSPTSDDDMFSVFIASQKEISEGRYTKYKNIHRGKLDEIRIELGELIRKYLKNDFSVIINIFSPHVVVSSPEYNDFKALIEKNKNYYVFEPVNRYVQTEMHKLYNDFANNGKSDERIRKKIATLGNTIQFFINWLNDKILYTQTPYCIFPDIDDLMIQFKRTYQQKGKILKPNRDIFLSWLQNIRQKD